ncbi:MAG: chemotaxis protein CheC [Candidatus Omnitrophica bacterium]|nr:chemotaxis protein CheC [Candidatus Omnitrophota bacterium]
MAELTSVQLDALKEMGNIGAGNAATSLAQLIGEIVNISVPEVKVLPIESVAEALGGAEKQVYIIYLEVEKEMQGTMLTIFSQETAFFFVKKLLGSSEIDMTSDIAQSALKEVGSILCGSYLSALSQLVNMSSVATVPAMAFDMLGAMLNFVLVEIGQIADEVFLVDTELAVSQKKLECSQLFLPKPDTLEKILTSIGMM